MLLKDPLCLPKVALHCLVLTPVLVLYFNSPRRVARYNTRFPVNVSSRQTTSTFLLVYVPCNIWSTLVLKNVSIPKYCVGRGVEGLCCPGNWFYHTLSKLHLQTAATTLYLILGFKQRVCRLVKASRERQACPGEGGHGRKGGISRFADWTQVGQGKNF